MTSHGKDKVIVNGFSRRLFLASSGAALVAAKGKAAEPMPVKVEGGEVLGTATAVPGVTAWLGVPFAAPPVGPLRWRPPQPVVPWQGVKRADRFGASPWAMPGTFDGRPDRQITMSEDCLTLNVWAPPKSHERKPVMVWIYGGAFVAGTTDDPQYDGANMAAEDVVFVSINYRVGILGFFAHPELAKESAEGVSGNYALLDQIAALRWVRDNIEAFGGDPDNVTILGQSAGSFSVAFHLVMPQSRGLFHRGIAQSGAPMGQVNGLSMISEAKGMEDAGVAFGRRIGAASLAGLRRVDPFALVKADHMTWIFNPALDGSVIPAHPFELIRTGRFADVPLIAGFNADEGAVFPPLGGGTPAGLAAALEPHFGAKTADALKVYASRTNEEAVQHGKEVFGDLIFNWNTAALAAAMARYGSKASYLYHFTYTGMSLPGHVGPPVAVHGAEIPLVLRTLASRGVPPTKEQRAISETLSDYWLAFARDGDPNGRARQPWPQFKPGKPSVLHMNGMTNSIGDLPFPERLALVGRAWSNDVLGLA